MIPDLIGLKAKLIAGGIALALCAAVFGAQEWRIHDKNKAIKEKDDKIVELNGDLAVANGNVARLTASIDRQNTAIEALKGQKAVMDAKARKQALDAQKKRADGVSIEGTGPDSMNKFFERLYE